jgi:hypothetical protein
MNRSVLSAATQRRMSRHPRLVAAVLGTVLSLALFLPVPASAGVLDVTCTVPSSESIVFQPPLTTTTQPTDITISSQYGVCVSASVPSLTSGTSFLQLTGIPQDCLDLGISDPAQRTITWNTGQTSTLSGNLFHNIVGATQVTTITGTVTSGLFAGDTFVHVVTAPAASITLCTLGLGTVPSLHGVITLEITSV